MEKTLPRLRSTALSFLPMLGEALKCIALAIKDSLSPKVIFYSVAIWGGSFLFWAGIFWWQWAHIIVLAQVGTAFLALGIFIFFPQLLGAGAATQAAMASAPVAAVAASVGFTIVSYVLVAVVFILLVLISVRILLEAFLMGYVQTRTLRRYPELQKGADNNWLEGLRGATGSTIKALVITFICLFIPVINGILILLIACYYSARSLVGDALEDLATVQEQKQFIRENRFGILVMGLLHFALLLIPFVGLLAPAIIGSSMCHFCMRGKVRQLAIRLQ
ncbi:hypothetical protein GCM10022409_20530 [Hymenobacter glaciei]|uniref:Glycerophosphoryl diester phosphodiesterase membrane domain-containing protein n=1 Tax=Hymenobacter glaciei TaxID=877209 RepID=A0ABP7U4F6_9BACT